MLAGGAAARLDGADKASVELDGRTLLTWALDAVLDAAEVVVVGDPVPTHRPVTFTREDPRYGGPVAALLTGRDALLDRRGALAVLACDMPHLTPATFRRLRDGRGRAATAPRWWARTAAASWRWCSTWTASTPYARGSRSSTAWPCTACWRPSTWPRCPPGARSTATWTRGPTCAT